MDKKRIRNVIEVNANLIDTSLVKFITECIYSFNDGADKLDMAYVLYSVLIETFGSFKNVVGVIVNDEGYFKWDSLDFLNKELSSNNRCTMGTLSYMYERIISNHPEAKEVITDIDFTIAPELYTDFGVPYKTLPPCILTSSYGDGYDRSIIKDNPDTNDWYSGFLVSKDMYPEAKDARDEKHKVVAERNHLEWLNDTKLSKMKMEDFSCICSTDYYYTRDVSNPGIIYVPTQSAVNSVLSRAGSYRKLTTCLPKHILEKYNLPTMEI